MAGKGDSEKDKVSKELNKSQGAISKRPPPLSRRPDNSSLPLQRQTSAKASSSSASVSARQFKKCMSATFQIDGHYYTIGRYVDWFVQSD